TSAVPFRMNSLESTSIGSFLQSSLSNALGDRPSKSFYRKRANAPTRPEAKHSVSSIHFNLNRNMTLLSITYIVQKYARLIDSIKTTNGHNLFQCRARDCGKWLREGEEFALHSLTHEKRRSSEKDKVISVIKGKDCDEIINHINTDVQQLSTFLSTRQNIPVSLSTPSSSRISSNLVDLNEITPSDPIGTKTDSIINEPSTSTIDMNDQASQDNQQNIKVSNGSSKRRFNWNLFVRGCVESQMNNESKENKSQDRMSELKRKRK
ncbi:hypothetical protein PRIPAC_77190, partial [Pristionchus pacificus]